MVGTIWNWVGPVCATETNVAMPANDDHIEPMRLIDASRDSNFDLNEEEKTHLAECDVCSQVFGVLVRAFDKESARGNGFAA